MEVISDPVRLFLATQPTQDNLYQFVKSYIPIDIKPTGFLHQINLNDQKNPICLYATLMVQDIRESHLYYPFIVQKPINQNSQFKIFKYQNPKVDIVQLIEDNKYAKVMMDRQTIICSSIKYQTEWIKKFKGYQHLYNNIEMLVDGRNQFKLGQVFHSICVWNPQSKKLYFIRQVGQKQANQVNLDKWSQIIKQKQINFQEERTLILNCFNKIFQETYSKYLLYTLLSTDKMFISGENIQHILKQLLPRVCRIQIKAPFKDSFFPYKNSQGELIETKMQMSLLNTFVIIDFSELTTSNEIKIDQQQIDNLKALKVFVEQQKTIYRWQYGESQVPHQHSGLIVKASNIITPDFQFKSNPNQLTNVFAQLSSQQMLKIRIYIEKARKLCPLLNQASRKLIQQDLKMEKSLTKDKINLKNLMRLSKINAMSYGRLQITYQDYIHSCKISC